MLPDMNTRMFIAQINCAVVHNFNKECIRLQEVPANSHLKPVEVKEYQIYRSANVASSPYYAHRKFGVSTTFVMIFT